MFYPSISLSIKIFPYWQEVQFHFQKVFVKRSPLMIYSADALKAIKSSKSSHTHFANMKVMAEMEVGGNVLVSRMLRSMQR